MRSLLPGTIHFDRADAGRLQPVAQGLLQLQILAQELGVILLGEPARPPGLGDAQPESVRMYFLTHSVPCLPRLLLPDLTTMCDDPPLIAVRAAHAEPDGCASCAALRSRRLR